MAAELTVAAGVAGRYAAAVFELAAERRALDAVASDLDSLQAALDSSPDLTRLIRSPVLSRDAQGRAVAAIAARLGVSEITRNFLGLAARKRRLYTVPAVVKAFKARLAAHRGETFAEVTTAEPLAAPELDAIKAQLAQKAGRAVTVTTAVDPAMLGGLVVKLGSRMYDGSVRSRLRSLTLAMKEVG